MKDTCRLYTDLAWLWPLWGDTATEYAHHCQYVTGLIRQYATRQTTTLLDIGCGGGKNVLNLKREFNVTGLDLSSTMLTQAQALNPDCTFVQGDMRTCRLGRTFDAVLMDDAISHMNCRADFASQCTCGHLWPGHNCIPAVQQRSDVLAPHSLQQRLERCHGNAVPLPHVHAPEQDYVRIHGDGRQSP